MNKNMILLTGACGQIGTVLSRALQQQHGYDNVLVTDLHDEPPFPCRYERLDATDQARLSELVEAYDVTEIWHLAAILSASGEKNPLRTWDINMKSLLHVLEIARTRPLSKVFYPSTIAVFGLLTPRELTPQHPNLTPETVYGISKAAGENWCNYYHKRYGVDVRSVRYPGIISWDSQPGGGTTDYAVEIFHEALAHGSYTCFLDADTRLPMMYMPDAVRATMELMSAPADRIRVRTSYNLGAMSFTPAEIAAYIQEHIPDFAVSYEPDFRQAIAATWPERIDDTAARADWGWQEQYDIRSMTHDIIHNLKAHAG